MIKKISIILLSVVFFSGCSITPHKVSIQNKVEATVDVISIVNQHELEALFPISNSSGVSVQFGLIGALVGSAIDASVNSSNAEKATNKLSPIRDKLIDFSFDEVLQSNIEQILDKHPTVSIGSVNTFKDHKAAQKQMTVGKYYLTLSTEYKLDMDFRVPFIVTYATLIKKGATKRKDETIYKNTFTYFAEMLPAPVKDRVALDAEIAKLKEERDSLTYKERKKTKRKYTKNIKKLSAVDYSFDESVSVLADVWSVSKSEQLKSNLSTGVVDIISLLAVDLADPVLAETYKENGQVLPGYPKRHKIIMLKDGDLRDVVRFSDGHRAGAVCSMPNLNTEETKLLCL